MHDNEGQRKTGQRPDTADYVQGEAVASPRKPMRGRIAAATGPAAPPVRHRWRWSRGDDRVKRPGLEKVYRFKLEDRMAWFGGESLAEAWRKAREFGRPSKFEFQFYASPMEVTLK